MSVGLQLRDMVPPQSPNSVAQDSSDLKRPKHVVLSDTIQLVRDLQQQVPPVGHSLHPRLTRLGFMCAGSQASYPHLVYLLTQQETWSACVSD